jgi:hypothetical protein
MQRPRVPCVVTTDPGGKEDFFRLAYDAEAKRSYLSDHILADGHVQSTIRILDHASGSSTSLCSIPLPLSSLFLVPRAHRTAKLHLLCAVQNTLAAVRSHRLLVVSATGEVTTVVSPSGLPLEMDQVGLVMDSAGRTILHKMTKLSRLTLTEQKDAIVATEEPWHDLPCWILDPALAIGPNDDVYFASRTPSSTALANSVVCVQASTGATTMLMHSIGYRWFEQLQVDHVTGDIYLASHWKILKVSPNGCVFDVAGHLSGHVDGDGADAQFYRNRGISIMRAEGANLDLLNCLQGADPLCRWPPGLAGLVESFARSPRPATGLLVLDKACIRRISFT